MAARPVYSHRFVYSEVSGGIWKQWRVPEGKRAVVRNVTLVGLAAGATGYAKVHGLLVFASGLLAAFGSESRDLRVVAYGGELIECAGEGSGVTVTVSGYLFDDPYHESHPPPYAATLPTEPEIPQPPRIEAR